MKKSYLSVCITLILSIIPIYSSAAEATYSAPPSLLEKIDKDHFKDHAGRVIYYPCNMGGEPLVIYSSVDGKVISSKSTLMPVYLKSGYQATPITIPGYEMSDTESTKYLNIQMANPATDYFSIGLTRQDGQRFYVDTANFPVVDTISGAEGTLQKYVSTYNVSINNSPEIYKTIRFPTYNYNFIQSCGLYVYHYVKQITANMASWNQNKKWTDGRLGRNFSDIPYRYSPIRVIDGGKITSDGFGFWICGSDVKQDDNKIGDQASYTDRAHQLIN